MELLNSAPWRNAIGVLLLMEFTTGSARAANELEKELSIVASEVAKSLKGLNENSIAIGQFTGPPQLASNSGPGIAAVLSRELGKHAIRIRPRAKLGLQGKYQVTSGERGRSQAVRIQGEIVELTGKVVFTFTRRVSDTASMAILLGKTGKVPVPQVPSPSSGSDHGKGTIWINDPEPQTYTQLALIATGPNSPYGIEIWIKSDDDYQPRPATVEDGLAFVEIHRGEIYAVRVVNDSPRDAAVTLHVDGISVFAFSENQNYKHFILGASSRKLIKGWHRTNEHSDSFQVTAYAQSAAADVLPSSASVGTITCTFAEAFDSKGQYEAELRERNRRTRLPEPVQAPGDLMARQDESATRQAPPTADASAPLNATGRGPKVSSAYNVVRKHVAPIIREAVSVRYTKTDAVASLKSVGPQPYLIGELSAPLRDKGDWIEVLTPSADVKLGRKVIANVNTGDLLRLADGAGPGDWYYVRVLQRNGASRNGWIHSRHVRRFKKDK